MCDAGGFCGFHDWACSDARQAKSSAFCSNLNNRIIWSFMPFPGIKNGLVSGCNVFEPYGSVLLPAPHDAASPVAGALDSYVSVLMHELMEAATDPYINAWLHNFAENSEAGDLCAYTYGQSDFYYCGLPSIYGTFHGSTDPSVCQTYPSWHAMRWVATGEIFNVFGTGQSKFLVQKIWSLANKGCQLQLQGMLARLLIAWTIVNLLATLQSLSQVYSTVELGYSWLSLVGSAGNSEPIGS